MSAVDVRGLSAIRQKLGRLAQVLQIPQVEFQLPSKEAAKLGWLAKGGRDMQHVNVKLAGEMGAAYAKGLVEVLRGAPITRPWERAGEAYVKRLGQRLLRGGDDIKGLLKPLKPATIKRKGHSRIGYDTGDLYHSVVGAKVRVTK